MSNLMMVEYDEAPRAGAQSLEALNEKVDRILVAIERIDERRQELEDLVTDVMPSANAAMRIAIERLDRLEKSGALAFATTSLGALERVAQTVDPADVTALAERAGDAVRTALLLTAPEVSAVAERGTEALARARRGRPPSLWQLFKARKEPRVRRGAGALLDMLRAIGDGVPGSAAARPAPRPVARRPQQRSAPACPAPSVAAPATAEGAHDRTIAGVTVHVDREGFLTDRTQWTKPIAEALAAEAGIATLTERHWEVVEFCRRDAAESGAAPGMRRITQSLGIKPAELYALFPKGPGILAARIAGLSKPKSCV